MGFPALKRDVSAFYPRRWPAVVSNPLPDVPYVNEPVGIRVSFFQGECPTALFLKVRNPAGVAVDFQYEPAAHSLTEGSMATWPDGSLRFGTLWVVVPSLAGGEQQVWFVELYSSAQAYSPTQLVTYTVTDASNELFQTARVSLNFRDTSAWMPQSLIDRATSQEMLATATGLTMRIRVTVAGGEKLSSTSAHIGSLAKTRVGSANTGYGVAFQEFESSWTWADTPWNTRVRTRLWANGRVTMQAYTVATNSAASEQKYLIFNISANNTSIVTNTGDNEKGRKLWEYAGGRFFCGFRYLTADYEVKTTETHSTNWSTAVAANRMFGGWIGTTTIPAGAYWLQSCFMAFYNANDVEGEWQRGMNPLITVAGRWSIQECRTYMIGFASKYIGAWLPISTDTDKKGLEGGLRIVKGDIDGVGYNASDALTLFSQYTAGAGVATPTSAASWTAAWTAGQGMNFIAKNGESLPIIYRRAIAQGDTASATTAMQIMIALAEFVVAAEVTSGGGGQMKLDNATGEDNYNAEASAMSLLAQVMKEIGPRSSWTQCYDRLAARYISGNFAGGTRRCYQLQVPGSLPHECIKAPQSTYDAYQDHEFARAHVLRPINGGRVPDMRQYMYEITNAAWQPEDRLYQSQVKRRGLSNTLLHWAVPAALNGNISDWNALAQIALACMRHVRLKNGQQHPQHGYTGTDVTMLNVMGDIRGVAEVVRLGL